MFLAFQFYTCTVVLIHIIKLEMIGFVTCVVLWSYNLLPVSSCVRVALL